jgi:CRISPR-associated protein Cmr4
LEIFSKIKDKKPTRGDILKRSGRTIKDKIDDWIKYTKDNNGEDKDNNGEDANGKWDTSKWYFFKGNTLLEINCAGQDNTPQEELSNIVAKNKEGRTGHCGHCLVCKGFGFSKKDISWQGMIYFSDLNILFFPVFTMYGTRWITTVERLKEAGLNSNNSSPAGNKVLTKNGNEGHINLGWLYLKVGKQQHPVSLNNNIQFGNFQLNDEDIVIVPDNLFSQIVNSNLEIRTSVSIDPITGAAKEGALFTSEAIPRGTILYGNIRIFDKSSFTGIDNRLEPLPSIDELECALKESKHFFETLGIGGMTTRGFGRLKIKFNEDLEKKRL